MRARWICAWIALIMFITPAAGLNEMEAATSMTLHGPMLERFEANVRQWLEVAPYANPGMLQMYFRRDLEPMPDIVPWYGEFSGKYLTSAALAYRMLPADSLKQAIEYVVLGLERAQSPEGYLGVFPADQRLQGKTASGHKTWDVWGHYHNMLGLYLWHQQTGDEAALRICLKAADYIHDFYVRSGRPLDEDKDGTDAAIGHIAALIYQKTGDQKHLDLVNAAFQGFESKKGGDYFRAGLEGRSFYKMKRTRWECLHAIQAIYEMYNITGEQDYRTSFENIWNSIAIFDRHNTGGFSSGESASGNPYDTRAIETCCTIAWMALSVDMLNLTGDSYVADELELSTWNGYLGAMSASGRWFTYNTPMLGDKKASAHDIVFQSVAGSPELNCCSVNAPRGFGMIPDWAASVKDGAIALNYYGASEIRLFAQGKAVRIEQRGEYPFDERITIRIHSEDGYHGPIRLRIPFWSEATRVTLNGLELSGVTPRSYLTIPEVRDGDEIEITFDFSLHYWQGDLEVGAKVSVYRGPILLAYDQRFNKAPYTEAPALDLKQMAYERTGSADSLFPQPFLLLSFKDERKNPVVLCDFTSAGQTGAGYTTWIPVKNGLETPRYTLNPPMWGRRTNQD
jgi:DUF1680 family protein